LALQLRLLGVQDALQDGVALLKLPHRTLELVNLLILLLVLVGGGEHG